ncbi:uncharacterized protein LOC130789417 [Actinidia eriantha]|uniref:uncharacterized protein LOC130789417 n=1 Tax=Actinidia eriantha TaxID=165200 RepID=UPI002588076D|nr:uncharacterized protein LOC130789417 [Actinidia eriantha]XP_057506149.1 uncharacterized protein LOC130789417 [Actinidia eriantha]
MDTWRRNRSDNYNQEGTTTRLQYRKPPLGSWQPTVPAWEKKFCTMVGAVPWGKLVDTKKFIHLYENILKWNDSAGEEAFLNAKNRFWADINGLPCDIALPDPDVYIDKIDWNSDDVDPELYLDLEREYTVPSDGEKREPVVIFTQPLGSNYMFSSSGWGDLEDDLKKTGPSPENKENPWESGWENGGENICNDSWNKSGWEGGWNNSSGWNQWENNNNEHDNWEAGRTGGGWDNRNQENNGRYMSRYKTSRFRDDDNLRNDQWRSGKGRKRVNFEQPLTTDKRPAPRQWHLGNSCAPIGHHGSVKPGHRWGKPVS